MIAKKDSILCVDEGEFGDYGVIGFFKVQKRFDPIIKLKKYLKENPEQKDDYCFKPLKFLDMLLEKGFLVKIEYDILHLGDYHCADTIAFKK